MRRRAFPAGVLVAYRASYAEHAGRGIRRPAPWRRRECRMLAWTDVEHVLASHIASTVAGGEYPNPDDLELYLRVRRHLRQRVLGL